MKQRLSSSGKAAFLLGQQVGVGLWLVGGVVCERVGCLIATGRSLLFFLEDGLPLILVYQSKTCTQRSRNLLGATNIGKCGHCNSYFLCVGNHAINMMVPEPYLGIVGITLIKPNLIVGIVS